MSTFDNLNGDLTTDAIPSPPKNEVSEEDKETEGMEHVDTKNQPKVTNSYKIPKSNTFNKTKKNATAFASVINISNANGIHIGSNYNIYTNKHEQKRKKDFIITDSVKALFNNTSPVNRKHLGFISPHLNEYWRDTARGLNYSDGQISQFYEDHIRNGIKEVIYQLLLDWIQNETDAASVGKLANTLWKTNQQDVVLRWSKNLNIQ